MMRHWKRSITSFTALAILGVLWVAPAMAAGPVPEAQELLPFEYARVWKAPVPVYASPGDPSQMTPVETLLPPDSWVSIDETLEQNGQLWYRVDDQAYVLAKDVSVGSPSTFHGLELAEPPLQPIGFVVAQQLNVRARPGTAADNPPVDKVARYDAVNILDSANDEGGVWYQIGVDRYVHAAYVRVVYPVARPADVPADARWIAVDLAQQTLSAYEGDRMVFATLVSSGRPPFYTPSGLYKIWIKLQTGPMEGGEVEKGDYYYLQDVPWIMYFARDVGLHGAYWHDRFGTASSHGCVNLSPLDAKWLFDWATPLLPFPDTRYVYASKNNPGTWIHVYASSD